jgi:ankyrin repeat protein
MADHDAPAPAALELPERPDLDWLRKEAKRRLVALRRERPEAKLAEAQLALARAYGFPSWRALKAHVDSRSLDGRLSAAAKEGDVATLTALLDAHPERLHARTGRYDWTLLHDAAHAGKLAVVELLLARGLDPNAKERGDETTALHWAAAAGHVDVVRRLLDAGTDPIGRGDDHGLEVIGWATCWDGCDDEAHREIVALLLAHGATHHIFSAIAMNLGDEVRRMVARDPAELRRTMSRNENHQLPLHFAVRMNRPEMVTLLLELGADPMAADSLGGTVAHYAASPDVDRRVLAALSARGALGVHGPLILGDEAEAARRLAAAGGRVANGELHLAAKRGDVRAVRWLLAHGADPNARWPHWDAEITPLHAAAFDGGADVARVLLDAGADPGIHDSLHDGDALGWAEHFGRVDLVHLLRERMAAS